jgi:hypothetical protein
VRGLRSLPRILRLVPRRSTFQPHKGDYCRPLALQYKAARVTRQMPNKKSNMLPREDPIHVTRNQHGVSYKIRGFVAEKVLQLHFPNRLACPSLLVARGFISH